MTVGVDASGDRAMRFMPPLTDGARLAVAAEADDEGELALLKVTVGLNVLAACNTLAV